MPQGVSTRAFVFILVGLFYSNMVFATSLTVNKVNDTADGSCDVIDCSLREAVIAANLSPGDDTITLPSGLYLLSLVGQGEDLAATGDLDITDNITLIGAGSAQTTIDGNHIGRVLHVMPGVVANLSGITVANGLLSPTPESPDELGAGLFNEGITTINESSFVGNLNPGFWGGAIENRANDPFEAQLTITNSHFSGNCAESGAVIDSNGSLTVIDSVFTGNVPVSTPEVQCSAGDGVFHLQGGTASIEGSTISDNIGAVGAMTVYGAVVSIVNTTIMNNQGITGTWSNMGTGGIENQNHGVITITNSTIANNTGFTVSGGISGSNVGNILLQNTIVALNTASAGSSDCSDNVWLPEVEGGGITSLGNNLIGSTAGCGIILQGTDLIGDPEFGPVENISTQDGGAFLPLLSSSQAIDAGDNVSCAADDQRDQARPEDGNEDGIATCDIGAIENVAQLPEPGGDSVYTYAWTNPVGGNLQDGVGDVATDANGNVYIVGHFSSTVDFDPSVAGSDIRTTASYEIYVTKQNSDGSYAWTKTFGGAGSDYGYDIALDDLGNIYVTGIFYSSADFDPGPGVDIHDLGDSYSIFVTRLNADGSYGWTRTIDTNYGIYGRYGNGIDIALDGAGGVYLTGFFVGSVDFDNAGLGDVRASVVSTYGSFYPVSTKDIFLTKFGVDGSYGWTHTMGSYGDDTSTALVADDNHNIYLAGIYEGSIDFDLGPAVELLTAPIGGDVFVVQYLPDGSYGWGRTLSSRSGYRGFGQHVFSIDVGPGGVLYLVGTFMGTIDFDPGMGVDNHTGGEYSGNAFLSKWLVDGSYDWTKAIGVDSSVNGTQSSGRSVAVGLNGDVFVGGMFRGIIDFDPGAGVDTYSSLTTYSYSSFWSREDTFMTNFKADGSYVWTKAMGAYNVRDVVKGIAVDPDGSVIQVGHFVDTNTNATSWIDFDPGPAEDGYRSKGRTDVFVTKWDFSLMPAN